MEDGGGVGGIRNSKENRKVGVRKPCLNYVLCKTEFLLFFFLRSACYILFAWKSRTESAGRFHNGVELAW